MNSFSCIKYVNLMLKKYAVLFMRYANLDNFECIYVQESRKMYMSK